MKWQYHTNIILIGRGAEYLFEIKPFDIIDTYVINGRRLVLKQKLPQVNITFKAQTRYRFC